MVVYFHKILLVVGSFFLMPHECKLETKDKEAYAFKLIINNCNYSLMLVPSKPCQGDNVSISRIKRSVEQIQNGQISKVLQEMESLSSKLTKLQKKMIREMRHLSTRMLRGFRKLDPSITDLSSVGDVGSNEKGNRLSPSNKCPQGFTYVDNWISCYMFSRFNTSWYQARDFCTALESNLVSFESLQEHHLVSFLIKNHPDYNEASGWWTSGTYVEKTKQWMWTSQNTPFSFIKWAVNEPNDKHEKDLQCVMMYKLDDHLWHDQICIDKYNFICEKTL